MRYRASMGSQGGRCQSSSLSSCRRAQTQRTPRALQTPRGHTRDAEQALHAVSAQGYRKEGGNAAGGTTACFPSPSLPPHGRKQCSSTRQGKAARIKKPQPRNGRGQPIQAAAPFPRKDVSALCRAGLLARGITLLSAPSQGRAPQWSLQISIRLQLRGSDGFAPSSLVTVSDCDQPY